MKVWQNAFLALALTGCSIVLASNELASAATPAAQNLEIHNHDGGCLGLGVVGDPRTGEFTTGTIGDNCDALREWAFQSIGNGAYQITNGNKCLTYGSITFLGDGVNGFRVEDDDVVQPAPCSTGKSFQWYVNRNTKAGTFNIKNVNSGKCLDRGSIAVEVSNGFDPKTGFPVYQTITENGIAVTGSCGTGDGTVWDLHPSPIAMSFTANTGILWTVDAAGVGHNTGLGVAPGTSPSVAALPSGETEVAFQADTGILWTVDAAGVGHNTGLGMAHGTSPSMAALPSGETEVAFQADTGILWTVDAAGVGHNTGLSMAPGTSPSVAALPSGETEIAFQANTGALWTVDGHGVGHPTTNNMASHTSPSISTTGEIAFQAETGLLWWIADGVANPTGLGMAAGTSPSITAPSSGGTEIAFQANTGLLWTVGPDRAFAGHSTGLAMAPGTSPSLTSAFGGNEIAFQANTGALWTVDTDGVGHAMSLNMRPGTSPTISAS